MGTDQFPGPSMFNDYQHPLTCQSVLKSTFPEAVRKNIQTYYDLNEVKSGIRIYVGYFVIQPTVNLFVT